MSEEKPLVRMAELSAYVRDESGELRPRMETLSKSGASFGHWVEESSDDPE